MKRECANTTHISIQYQYYEVKVKIIIDYFHVLELQEVKLQRIFQKISQSLSGSEHFCGSIQLDVIRVITSRLEVKIFFSQWHRQKRERENLHTTLKQNVQSLSNYAQQDLSVVTRRP
jgi:hypothetical protein